MEQFPIRIATLEQDDDGYYGIFREVIESQKAINQAMIQIQLLANVNKVYVNKTAVDDINKFKDTFNRVNSIIEMKDINGVRIDNLNGDIVQAYHIIDNALNRIKTVLNLNDSFLGAMGSSASGRQIKIQQGMTVGSISYIAKDIESIYEFLGEDILRFAQKYYKSYKIIRVTDELTGDRYNAINVPFTMPTDDGGYELVPKNIDYDDEGNANIEYWRERETQIEFLDFEIEITTANYNENDDLERVQLDQLINGGAGAFLQQASPASYAKVVALSMKAMKTRNSEYIAEIFGEVANQLQPAPTADPRLIGNAPQAQGGGAGAMLDALGATNDLAPDGYNRPKG